jgi:hypothetical protein
MPGDVTRHKRERGTKVRRQTPKQLLTKGKECLPLGGLVRQAACTLLADHDAGRFSQQREHNDKAPSP